MTIKEVLESAKDQIQHLDAHAKVIDNSGQFHYPLFSTTKAVELLDETIQDDITQELTTRLYNLVNAWDRRHPITLDDIEVKEARETLKKVPERKRFQNDHPATVFADEQSFD